MVNGGRPPFWKRKYIVDPALQWEITGYFAGTLALIVGILLWGTRSLLGDTLQSMRTLGLAPGNSAYDLVQSQMTAVNRLFAADSVVALASVVIGGILLSHRIVGPIYRLRLTLEKLARGERIDPIHFREGDYFQGLAETLNEVAARQRGDASPTEPAATLDSRKT